jgi:predicted phage terminase large subunit-like protein
MNAAVANQLNYKPDRLSVFSDREKLMEAIDRVAAKRREWLRRLIVHGNRVDILARILGYEVHPRVHLPIIQHQFRHRTSLVLMPRGSGKTLIGTVTKCIHFLVKRRDSKILIVSKTAINAQEMLKTVRSQLENNKLLIELFGPFAPPDRNSDLAWSNKEIEVRGIKLAGDRVTPSVMAIGIGGALPSKHFDYILADDLVDEENSATKARREACVTWLTKVMLPTLNPPAPENPDIGQIHYIGTCWHADDLYQTLREGDCKNSTLRIKALDRHDPNDPDPEQSFYPERFSAEYLKAKRESIGAIAFNAGYQNDVEAMKGKIFKYENLIPATEEEANAAPGIIVMAVDLAAKQANDADRFAISVIKLTLEREPRVFSLYSYISRLGVQQQAEKIVDIAQLYKPIRIGIEANGYQLVQISLAKEVARRRGLTLNFVPIYTSRDKEIRAQNLVPLFEQERVLFLPGQERLKEELVLMPDGDHDDGFDALEMAISLSLRRRKRKTREKEPDFL